MKVCNKCKFNKDGKCFITNCQESGECKLYGFTAEQLKILGENFVLHKCNLLKELKLTKKAINYLIRGLYIKGIKL